MASASGSRTLDPASTAVQFAEALDRDDFAAAAALISSACIYEARQGQLVGPEQICHSYREASDWGRKNLESLSYESRVEEPSGHELSVLFIDYITHKGRTHTYPCRQQLRISAEGLIEYIRHVELPGQREALVRFLSGVDVSLP